MGIKKIHLERKTNEIQKSKPFYKLAFVYNLSRSLRYFGILRHAEKDTYN